MKTYQNGLKIFVCLLFIYMGDYCQAQRYADLRVEFISPQPNSQIKSPIVLHYSFKVINQGPDTIFATDTIIFRPGHLFRISAYKRKMNVGEMVAIGDSFTVDDTVFVNSTKDRDDFYLTFALPPLTYGPDLGKGSLHSEFAEDRKDNAPALYLKHKGGSVQVPNVDMVKTKIYPNPTTDESFNIRFSGQLKFVAINDILGKKIEFEQTIGQGISQIRLNSPYKGMVLVKLFADGHYQIIPVLLE